MKLELECPYISVMFRIRFGATTGTEVGVSSLILIFVEMTSSSLTFMILFMFALPLTLEEKLPKNFDWSTVGLAGDIDRTNGLNF